MSIFSRSLVLLAVSSIVTALPSPERLALRAPQPFSVPFYNTSANGFTSPARGWNSFAIQALSSKGQSNAGWANNDYHYRQHCSNIQVEDGFDYICSIDSGWSVGCSGDDNGVMENDPTIIPDVHDLADFLHGKSLKLGLYVVPGGFQADANKTIEGTNIKLGSVFNSSDPTPNCRAGFNYGQDGVQQWHDSVVKKFLGWGVDFIKLDYMTPGSPDSGETLSANTSGAAIAYHQAIKNNNAEGKMRLDISWKLDRSDPYWGIWQSSADTLRVDQDTNNAGKDSLVSWTSVLRTLDYYRQFINEQTAQGRQGKAIMIRPDLDNTFVGNPENISGLSDVQRYTQAAMWIGAGANIITGSDMTHLDTLGQQLLYDPEAMGVAAFTAQYPMQPRNPSGWGTAGGNAAMQCQAWIAGPNNNGTAVVMLSNYGPDPCLDKGNGCTPTYGLNWAGNHNVSIGLDDLGIGQNQPNGSNKWGVRRVWGGGGQGGQDHTGGWTVSDQIQSSLGPGETVMYVLTKQ